MKQKQKQQVIVNIGSEILKGLKKKKKKRRLGDRNKKGQPSKQPFTYVPPQVPHQSVAPLNPVSNKQQERETQRIWATLTDIQRNAVRTEKENERKYGKRTGLINPKSLQIEDKKESPRDKLEANYKKYKNKNREDKSLTLSDEESRKRELLDRRQAKQEQRLRNSNQAEDNLKSQSENPEPSRNVSGKHPSVKQRVLSRLGLGGKQKVSPLENQEEQPLRLRSTDYYDGKKSGGGEARQQAQQEIRGLSRKISSANPTFRTQTAIHAQLNLVNQRLGGSDLSPPRGSGRPRRPLPDGPPPLGGGGGGGAGNLPQREDDYYQEGKI